MRMLRSAVPVALGLSCLASVSWLACVAAQHSEATVADATVADATVADAKSPRATMHAIFDGISELWPLMLDDQNYLSDAGQQRSRELIDELAEQGWQLEKHAQARDVDFRYLARSLSADFREARRLLAADGAEEARFFVAAAIQNCVLCHSRLPKARDFPIADKLTSALPIKDLSLEERALYQVAVRAFESAMSSWEQYFSSDEAGVDDILLLRSVEEYLRTAVVVQRDPERARATLLRLAKREDIGAEAEARLIAWSTALAESGPAIREPATLEKIRALAGSEGGMRQGRRTVHDIIALGLLARFLDEGVDDAGRRTIGATDRAEAYHWIGLIEARNDDPFWSAQAEFHLELAVRSAPGSPAATNAFRALEAMPNARAATLMDLQELIDSANPRDD